MKTFILNHAINYSEIWTDVSIYVCLWLVALILITIWAAKNWRNSIREEYLVKTTSKICALTAQIDDLTKDRDFYKKCFNDYKIEATNELIERQNNINELDLRLTAAIQHNDDANMKIIELESKVQKRNPDGTFAKTSGNGHGKKKQVEKDWTKATKKELLDEAKRRYPIGTKYKDVVYNITYISDSLPYFYLESKTHVNPMAVLYGGGYIYADGKWAEIVK